MAKVLPITGTPDPALLGFALGKAQAMEKGTIAFQKKLQTDNGVAQFRRAPNGVVTAFVKSNGVFAALYSGVQVPETVNVDGIVPVDGRPKLRTGVFPATESNLAVYPFQRLFGRSRFGVSPYSKKFIRYTQISAGPSADDGEESPYSGPQTGRFYSVYTDKGKVARERLAVYTPNKPAYIRFNDFVHSVCAGDRAIVVTREYENTFQTTQVVNRVGVQPADTDITSTRITRGRSWIRIRIVSNKEGVSTYRFVDTAELPYFESLVTRDDRSFLGPYGLRDELTRNETNSLLPSLPARSWHGAEFVTFAPNGAGLVVRETNQTYFAQQNETSRFIPFVGVTQTTARQDSANRGLSVSFVAPDDTVMDGIYTRSLGEFGYVLNVIPSADGKKVYVYYGLHDAATDPKPPDSPPEPFGGPAPFLPKNYTEHLDVIDITVTGSGESRTYAFEKTSTLDLGPIVLRDVLRFGNSGAAIGTDHYESKLFGAALAVSGFIWANRFCLNLKTLEFTPIPGFEDFFFPRTKGVFERVLNMVTDTEAQYTTYLAVNTNGRTAGYYLLKFGLSVFYRLATDEQGDTVIREDLRLDVPGDFRLRPLTQLPGNPSDIEDLTGQTVQFSKPTA